MANIVEVRLAAGSDDAEEIRSSGYVEIDSRDLELSNDIGYSGPQIGGLRFAGLNIPPDAIITSAWIQFTASALDAEPTTLTIQAQASANAATFTSGYFNISSRPTTIGAMSWTPDHWTTVGDSSLAQQTADLSALVQEVVSQTGWSAGNAMAFMINGFGTRTAYSFESGAARAPVLHIEYTLDASNGPPIAANDSAATFEDTPISVSVLGNDSDPDGDTLTVAGIGQPKHGIAKLNVDGTITWTPSANWFGTDSLSYTISDGHGGLAHGSISFTVAAVDDAPVAIDDLAVLKVDTAAIIKVLANDKDADRDTLGITSIGSVLNGVATIQSDGTIRYAPNAGFVGIDTFTYTISDGRGGTDTAAVTVHVSTGFSPVTFAAFGDYGVDNGHELDVSRLVRSLNPGFIVTLGDNTYGGLNTPDNAVGKYYSDFIGNYQGAYGPGSPTNRFFPSLGNHDLTDGGGFEAYSSFFPIPESSSGNNRYYDFIQGPVHFFVMNSDAREPDGTDINSAQVQWLRDALARSVTPWQVVIVGEPPFSSGTMHGSSPDLQLPFEQWGADAILSGDEHNYERILRDDNHDGINLPYLVVGTGGAGLYPFGTLVAGSTVRYNANYGALLGSATDTELKFDYWSVGGGDTLIDSYAVEKPTTPPPQPPQVVESHVSAGSDDAEERRSTGQVSLGSTDLELINDSDYWGVQTVGLRFSALDVPLDAIITSAWIQFTVDERQNEVTNLTIKAQASTNAGTFSTSGYNITGRPTTESAVVWSPSAWTTVGASGLNERTSDLSVLVQEVVSQSGWSAGNAIAFIIGGDGHRTAFAFEGATTKAPVLHVEYRLPGVSAPNSLDLSADDDTGASASDNLTSLATGLTISGKAPSGATVTLFDDVNNNGVHDAGEPVVGTVVAAGDAFWQDISLSEGLHHLRAFQTDAEGNLSGASTALDVIIDTTPPAAPGGLDLAAEDDTGPSQTDNITRNTSSLTISGSAEAGAILTLFDDVNNNGARDNTEAILGTTVAAGGAFVTDVTLAAGPHRMRAFQTDPAGNVSGSSAALDMTVDTSAPTAPASLDLAAEDDTGLSQTDNTTRNSSGITISGSAETGATVTLFDDVNNNGVRDPSEAALALVTAVSNGFRTDISLGEGVHRIRALQSDPAGNVSGSSLVLSITVDTTAPVPSYTSETFSNNRVILTGISEASSKVTIFDGATAVGTVNASTSGQFTFTLAKPSNTVHLFQATASDAAGNSGASALAVLGSTNGDTLTGSLGSDLYLGRAGPDRFVFNSPTFGRDVISDFQATGSGHDIIRFDRTVFTDFSEVQGHAAQGGSDVVITFDANNAVTLTGVSLASLSASDFQFV